MEIHFTVKVFTLFTYKMLENELDVYFIKVYILFQYQIKVHLYWIGNEVNYVDKKSILDKTSDMK